MQEGVYKGCLPMIVVRLVEFKVRAWSSSNRYGSRDLRCWCWWRSRRSRRRLSDWDRRCSWSWDTLSNRWSKWYSTKALNQVLELLIEKGNLVLQLNKLVDKCLLVIREWWLLGLVESIRELGICHAFV